MGLGVINKIIVTALVLVSHGAVSQSKLEATQPPTLKNGKSFASFIRLEYSQAPNTFRVMTIRFKIDNGGTLDTLSVSDNAPLEFAKSVKNQLTKLNGQWQPQRINGKLSTVSKWLIIRFYVAGYISDSTECLHGAVTEFITAYQREADLFQCSVRLDQPLKCSTDYLEGHDYFLLPTWVITS